MVFEDVPNLTSKQFKIGEKNIDIKNFGPGLILFYADWCPHCHNMEDDWIELYNRFKNIFNIAVINCEDDINTRLCDKAKIVGYPTIKYVSKKGRLQNYKGILNMNDILYFICSRI